METTKNAFLFYRTYFDAIQKLPKAKQLAFYEAICLYALDGMQPVFKDPASDMAFILIRGNLDACDKRYYTSAENGKKGGRPKKSYESQYGQKPNSKPNRNQTQNLKKPNGNLNKDVDKDVESLSASADKVRSSSSTGSQPSPNLPADELREYTSAVLAKLEESAQEEEAQIERENLERLEKITKAREEDLAQRRALVETWKEKLAEQRGEEIAG